jgi:hypothetical protein
MAMAQMITGLFPDRETAEHAMSRLEAIGLHPARMNAEDFDRPDYYTGQMPQGATLISVDAVGCGEDVRRIILEAGGRDVEGVARGQSDMPTSRNGNPAGSVPVPADERQALAKKAGESRAEWQEEQGM